MAYREKPRSNAWFLLPIFLGLIGGVIAFFILRHDDPRKAKNCLYLGVVLMIIGLVLNLILASSLPDIGPGFNVNI